MKKLVKDRESLIGWIFTLPAIIYMAILVGYSIIYNIVLSLQKHRCTRGTNKIK